MADGLLGEIVARKRIDVAARLGGGAPAARPTRRSLRAALARPGARFVMEVKKVSPSAGALRPGADPAEIASAYRDDNSAADGRPTLMPAIIDAVRARASVGEVADVLRQEWGAFVPA